MKQYDPQMGNPGPHDAQLAVLVNDWMQSLTAKRPYLEVGDIEADEINVLIDNINGIFEREIIQASKYRQEAADARYDGLS